MNADILSTKINNIFFLLRENEKDDLYSGKNNYSSHLIGEINKIKASAGTSTVNKIINDINQILKSFLANITRQELLFLNGEILALIAEFVTTDSVVTNDDEKREKLLNEITLMEKNIELLRKKIEAQSIISQTLKDNIQILGLRRDKLWTSYENNLTIYPIMKNFDLIDITYSTIDKLVIQAAMNLDNAKGDNIKSLQKIFNGLQSIQTEIESIKDRQFARHAACFGEDGQPNIEKIIEYKKQIEADQKTAEALLQKAFKYCPEEAGFNAIINECREGRAQIDTKYTNLENEVKNNTLGQAEKTIVSLEQILTSSTTLENPDEIRNHVNSLKTQCFKLKLPNDPSRVMNHMRITMDNIFNNKDIINLMKNKDFEPIMKNLILANTPNKAEAPKQKKSNLNNNVVPIKLPILEPDKPPPLEPLPISAELSAKLLIELDKLEDEEVELYDNEILSDINALITEALEMDIPTAKKDKLESIKSDIGKQDDIINMKHVHSFKIIMESLPQNKSMKKFLSNINAISEETPRTSLRNKN